MGVSRLAFLVIAMCTIGVSAQSNEVNKDCPGGVRDITFVFEVPEKKAKREVADLKHLYASLHKNETDALRCLHYSLVVAVDVVDVVQPLDCQSKRCFDQALDELDSIANRLQNVGSRDATLYKNNFVKAVQGLNETVFSEEMGGRPEAEKTVVLLLSAKKHGKVSITEATSLMHTDPSFSVIAIGINDARGEELLEAALFYNRILSVNTIREIFPGKPGYDIIESLLENPDFDRHSVENLPQRLLECDFVADVGFLIDASNSIRENYLSELQFVKYVAASFGISKNGSHAGAVIYSDRGSFSQASIKFSDYYSTPELVKAVERVDHFGYRTRIDLAFTVAENELFTKKGGLRDDPKVKKVIYLITDGEQNPKKEKGIKLDPVEASRKLYEDGVEIFAIGIGNLVNRQELEKITRNPKRVFLANHPNELAGVEFVKMLATNTCNDVVPLPTNATTTATTTTPEVTTTPTTTTTTTSTTTTTATTPTTTTTATKPITATTSLSTDASITTTATLITNPHTTNDNLPSTTTITKPTTTTALTTTSTTTTTTTTPTTTTTTTKPITATTSLSTGASITTTATLITNPQTINDNLPSTTTTTTPLPTTNTPTQPQPAKLELSPCPTKPEPKCTGVGKCGACCPGQQIYLNLFFPGNNANYVLQGTQELSQNKDGIPKVLAGNNNENVVPDVNVGNGFNKDQVINLIKSKLPTGNEELLKSIDSIISNYTPEKARKNRSKRNILPKKPAEVTGLYKMLSMVNVSGCHEFIKDMSIFEITKNLLALKNLLKAPVRIFCPTDQRYVAYKKTHKLHGNEVKRLLLDHVATAFGSSGAMFQSISKQSKLITRKHDAKPLYTINNANVLLSVHDSSTNLTFTVIDDVLKSPKLSVLDVLRNTHSLSTMFSLAKSSSLKRLITGVHKITEVCFSKHFCVQMSKELTQHFNELSMFRQFTFQLMENSVFEQMPKRQLNNMMKSPKSRDSFVKKHIFLGILEQHKDNGSKRMIALSLKNKHPVAEFITRKNGARKHQITRNGHMAYFIKKTIRVKEGLVQILAPYKN